MYKKTIIIITFFISLISFKEIYASLVIQTSMTVDLPNLGFGDFFYDFEKNIYTKIVLLINIAYIIAQFIKLFTINFNLNGGK